jgi:hypothetical protein
MWDLRRHDELEEEMNDVSVIPLLAARYRGSEVGIGRANKGIHHEGKRYRGLDTVARGEYFVLWCHTADRRGIHSSPLCTTALDIALQPRV